MEHDTKALTSCQAILAKSLEKGLVFLKTDCKKHLFTLGTHHRCFHGVHAFEVTYDHKKATEGILGQPVTARTAHDVVLKNGMTFKIAAQAGKKINVKTQLGHKVDERLTLYIADDLNADSLLKPSTFRYNYGIKACFNL
jgi:hypothetical protein